MVKDALVSVTLSHRCQLIVPFLTKKVIFWRCWENQGWHRWTFYHYRFLHYIVLTQPCWPLGWMFSGSCGQDCGQERWWQWWHLSLRYATPLTIHHNHLGRTFITIRRRPFRMVRKARQSEEKYKYKYKYKHKYSNCSPSGACLQQRVEDQAALSSPPLEPALLAI